MKQKYLNPNETEEMEMLSEQLDSREMFILGFLKGVNRRVMREWQEEGIGDYYSEFT